MPYLVKIYGHLNPEKRTYHPKLPDTLVVQATYPYDDKDGLVEMVKNIMQSCIAVQGMGTTLNPSGMQDPKQLDLNRVFVPMHMIDYIDAEAILVQGEVPMLDSENNVVLPSGKEIVKH
jgi:hypothetical protein